MLDPGGDEAISIAKNLSDRGIEIKHVLVSHGHFDHLGWAAEVQDVLQGARVYLHEGEKEAYEPFLDAMRHYGLDPGIIREPDVWVRDHQILDLSGYKFEVIHTPGHSPGSATFKLVDLPEDETSMYLQRDHSAFVGDCLFEGSIGRTDLPFASPDDMVTSLKRLMDELDGQTQIFPGHGNFTQMDREMTNNPFLLAIQRGISFF